MRADKVLVVCTETCQRRHQKREAPRKGKGVTWEGAILKQALYDAQDILFTTAKPKRGKLKKLPAEPQHRDVIDAMIDEILPDGVRPIHREGDLELGADAIDARNQHGLAVLPRVEREQPAEAAHLAQHFPPLHTLFVSRATPS